MDVGAADLGIGQHRAVGRAVAHELFHQPLDRLIAGAVGQLAGQRHDQPRQVIEHPFVGTLDPAHRPVGLGLALGVEDHHFRQPFGAVLEQIGNLPRPARNHVEARRAQRIGHRDHIARAFVVVVALDHFGQAEAGAVDRDRTQAAGLQRGDIAARQIAAGGGGMEMEGRDAIGRAIIGKGDPSRLAGARQQPDRLAAGRQIDPADILRGQHPRRQPDLRGDHRQRGGIAHPQRLVQHLELGLDRLDRERELAGHFLTRAARREQPGDGALSRAEPEHLAHRRIAVELERLVERAQLERGGDQRGLAGMAALGEGILEQGPRGLIGHPFAPRRLAQHPGLGQPAQQPFFRRGQPEHRTGPVEPVLPRIERGQPDRGMARAPSPAPLQPGRDHRPVAIAFHRQDQHHDRTGRFGVQEADLRRRPGTGQLEFQFLALCCGEGLLPIGVKAGGPGIEPADQPGFGKDRRRARRRGDRLVVRLVLGRKQIAQRALKLLEILGQQRPVAGFKGRALPIPVVDHPRPVCTCCPTRTAPGPIRTLAESDRRCAPVSLARRQFRPVAFLHCRMGLCWQVRGLIRLWGDGLP